MKPTEARSLLKGAHKIKHQLAETPIADILDVLEIVGKLWRKNGPYFKEALKALSKEITFSPQMLRHSLEILPELCSRKNLEARLLAEFADLDVLDRFLEREYFEGRVRFVPHGVLLHVSAGNVFLGAIDSLLIGLLSKNFNIVKLSHTNQTFPKLFAKSLREADKKKIVSPFAQFVHFKGGDPAIESVFCESVDAVIAWGGDEMIRSYRKKLPPGIPLIEHGPKISAQVVFKNAFQMQDEDVTAKAIAHDILMWDQAACASPQNCFIQAGIDPKALLKKVAVHLEKPEFPRGTIDGDESVEILKEAYRAQMTQTQGGTYEQGKTWLLHFDPRPGIRPSPLNRTLIFKAFKNLKDLKLQLAPARGSLQSCSYLATGRDRSELLNGLSTFGMQRFARLGTVMEGLTGAPHDGHYAVTELGRFIPDETRTDVLEFVNDRIQHVEFYKKLYKREVRRFKDLIPLDKLDIPIPADLAATRGGQIFSSGGTTGKPKYVYFSNSEFRKTAQLLAKGYRAQGLKPGDRCANLFVAGNLWSSFLAVEKALIDCQAVQLPIGGLADPKLILEYLERFKPKAVFGLPSLLVSLATQSKKLKIPYVFYAGEHLTLPGRKYLEQKWGAKHIHSAGYASVDAGPMGYQCPHTIAREHHVFEDSVHLEIENDEGIVTSLIRRSIPVIHLRTGDHLEWTSASGEPCKCGSTERRFLLHGRLDGQIRVFSSRLLLSEFEKALVAEKINGLFSIQIADDSKYHEKLTLTLEREALNKSQSEKLTQRIYNECRDLKATLSFAEFKLRLAIKTAKLPRVERTGKVRPVVDLRKI